MSKEAKSHYLNLVKNKELKEVFPKSKGEWDKDKIPFTKLYNENIKFIIDFENGQLEEVEENEFIDDTLF